MLWIPIAVLIVIIAGGLFLLHRWGKAAQCSTCRGWIEPAWNAFVIDGRLYCDVDCWRERPAVQRKAERPQRVGKNWYENPSP